MELESMSAGKKDFLMHIVHVGMPSVTPLLCLGTSQKNNVILLKGMVSHAINCVF